jgi:CRISPR-associated protein Cmx8
MDNDGKLAAKGYTLSIPDVADIREFSLAFPELLASLRLERRGFRPADALIDIPVQSSLEFLRHLRVLSSEKAKGEDWSACVSAVESFHMIKQGNNIKLLAFDRVANRPALVAKYDRIRNTFRNPLFRAAQLRSLLRDQPWYGGMLELFAERPWTFFVEHERTPRFIPRFGTDARTQFRAIFQDTQDMKNDEMSDSDRLGRIVQRLVNKYVEGRAEAKTGKKVKAFPKETVNGRERRIYPNEFREAQQRVCSDIFLSMRSRHDQDFVESFVGSICSVAQYLPSEDYQFLTSVLMRQSQKDATGPVLPCWEDVKALAMIAVSACSFATQPRESSTQQAKEKAT